MGTPGDLDLIECHLGEPLLITRTLRYDPVIVRLSLWIVQLVLQVLHPHLVPLQLIPVLRQLVIFGIQFLLGFMLHEFECLMDLFDLQLFFLFFGFQLVPLLVELGLEGLDGLVVLFLLVQ